MTDNSKTSSPWRISFPSRTWSDPKYSPDPVHVHHAYWPRAKPVAGTAVKTAERWHVYPNLLPVWDPRDGAKGRFRRLKHLKAGHDGGEAKAADPVSIDEAIAFIDRAEFEVVPLTTIDDDGMAVLEFKNKGDKSYAGDITFCHHGNMLKIECYARRAPEGQKVVEGDATDDEIRQFISEHLNVVLID